jgi:hypothetical protein
MSKELDEVEEGEAGVVAEKLIQHLDPTFHPFTLAAIGTALVVLNDDMQNEEDVEDCLDESCRTFFEFTLALMRRVDEKGQGMLWQTSQDIGRAVYGDLRVQKNAGLAIEEMRKYEADMDGESPHVSTTLN